MNIIDTLLPDDLKTFLFNKLRIKLQPLTKEENVISRYMLNFDNIQIVTALNAGLGRERSEVKRREAKPSECE